MKEPDTNRRLQRIVPADNVPQQDGCIAVEQRAVPAEVSLAEQRRHIAVMLRKARREAWVLANDGAQMGDILWWSGFATALVELAKAVVPKPHARDTGGNR